MVILEYLTIVYEVEMASSIKTVWSTLVRMATTSPEDQWAELGHVRTLASGVIQHLSVLVSCHGNQYSCSHGDEPSISFLFVVCTPIEFCEDVRCSNESNQYCQICESNYGLGFGESAYENLRDECLPLCSWLRSFCYPGNCTGSEDSCVCIDGFEGPDCLNCEPKRIPLYCITTPSHCITTPLYCTTAPPHCTTTPPHCTTTPSYCTTISSYFITILIHYQ